MNIISYYIIFQCIIHHYIIILISDYEGIYLDLVMSEGLGQKYGGPRRQAQEKIRTTGLRLFIIITFFNHFNHIYYYLRLFFFFDFTLLSSYLLSYFIFFVLFFIILFLFYYFIFVLLFYFCFIIFCLIIFCFIILFLKLIAIYIGIQSTQSSNKNIQYVMMSCIYISSFIFLVLE